MRAILPLTSLLSLLAGCYLSHGRDLPEERAPDASVRRVPDAGTPPPPAIPDAGSRFIADAAPLPDDEPDVAPGERPSDDPGAGDWGSPPDPS